MIGHYDLTLVALSYLVAILAAYSALYFGSQLAALSGSKNRLWLCLGALTMGSGIWVMHFVGMRAYIMPVAMTYDLGLTVISWFAAVVSSALALYMISKKNIHGLQLATASVVMGGGIALMHYLGMDAMQMSKELVYDPLIFVVSIGIAIGASGAALGICRYLHDRTGSRAIALQIVASLVMGAAICGMHYTGMAAVTIPVGARPDPTNLLSGDWLGLPLALATMLLIGMVLLASLMDYKKREAAVRQAEAAEARLRELAFVDSVTGLPNRSALEKHLLDQIIQHESNNTSFGVIYLDMANYRSIESALSDDTLVLIASRLKDIAGRKAYLARYSASGFMVVINDPENSQHAPMYQTLRQLQELITPDDVTVHWQAGRSAFPQTGRSSRMLVRVAMKTGDLSHIGSFNDLESAYANPMSAPLTA